MVTSTLSSVNDALKAVHRNFVASQGRVKIMNYDDMRSTGTEQYFDGHMTYEWPTIYTPAAGAVHFAFQNGVYNMRMWNNNGTMTTNCECNADGNWKKWSTPLPLIGRQFDKLQLQVLSKQWMEPPLKLWEISFWILSDLHVCFWGYETNNWFASSAIMV